MTPCEARQPAKVPPSSHARLASPPFLGWVETLIFQVDEADRTRTHHSERQEGSVTPSNMLIEVDEQTEQEKLIQTVNLL